VVVDERMGLTDYAISGNVCTKARNLRLNTYSTSANSNIANTRCGELSWDLGDRLIAVVKFTMRLGLFIMNLAAITMGILVLEA
jgi:hypothetical protein